MSEAMSEKIFLFRSEIENRRFGDGALRILESVLVAKDVRALIEIRSAVRELLRSEVMAVTREISEKSADQKLGVLEFFVRAFALVGDVESCLALKYEAFVLRNSNCVNDDNLQVSYEDWLQFAKDSLDNGFHRIAAKGFESALASIQSKNFSDVEPDALIVRDHVTNEIKKLKQRATILIASRSVQAQTAKYLKRKPIIADQKHGLFSPNAEHVASSMFRSGIKKRNMQKLYQSQVLPAESKC